VPGCRLAGDRLESRGLLAERWAGQLCRIFEHRFGTLPRLLSFCDHQFMEDATMGAILLWLLGIPIPIIIILLLLWH
jgi:hypothetical protein